ncbi:MAG: tetratricopeptide repeat protein [Myxococcales bacterium]|nr:tetratricopeptide repeat protein [Myxococcales bacterium]
MTSLQGEMARLQTEYLRPQRLDRNLNLASRLAEAQLRYFLQEWDAAAAMLVEIVENREFQSLAGWNDARFYLADSLFEDRNFTLSRSVFEEIVETGDPEYSLDASRRLLEIALALNEYDRLDELFASMQQRAGTSATPEISYVRGKALYFQGRDEEALASMAQVSAEHRLYDRAQYFVGVILTRLGRYGEALAVFESLAERLSDATSAESRDLLDLAILAIGRLHYEQQRWDDARFAYESIGLDSARIDVASYERAWTQIRQGSIREAIRTLEFLEVVARNPRYASEAALLRGDLYMRLQRYGEAVELFEAVADSYEPAELQLRATLESAREPSAFFEALIDPETVTLRLPTEVEPWVEEDTSLERALLMVVDRNTLLTDIDDCRLIIEELDAVLTGAAGAGLFPVFREGWGRVVELQGRLVLARASLVDAEAAALMDRTGASMRTQYAQVHDQRMQLQEQFLQSPRTFDEITESAQRATDVLNEDELDVFRSTQEIEGLLDELGALERFVQRQVLSRQRTQGEASRLQVQLDEVESELRGELEESQRLVEAIRIRQLQTSRSADVGYTERELRRRFVEALNEERELLRSARSGVSDVDFNRFDQSHETLDRVDEGVETFFSEISRMVAEQTADVRATLEEERAAMDRYEAALNRDQAEIDRLAGEIAIASFMDVQERFSGLTMRANLGILDVAWREKEDISDRITELFEERDREYRIMDADFAEIREER